MANTTRSTAAAAAAPKLKLLVDKKSRRVVYAEAGKDAVDFIFSLLTLPLASAARLLLERQIIGSLSNLYYSVGSIDDAYLLRPDRRRADLLFPTLLPPTPTLPLLGGPISCFKTLYYRCKQATSSSNIYYDRPRCTQFTNAPGLLCPDCKEPMTTAMSYFGAPMAEGGGGYVKSAVTYTVMDDLTVAPMSSISAITILNELHIADFSSLIERDVVLGREEGLELLKASLQSKTVLTDVFSKKIATWVGARTQN